MSVTTVRVLYIEHSILYAEFRIKCRISPASSVFQFCFAACGMNAASISQCIIQSRPNRDEIDALGILLPEPYCESRAFML